MNKEKFEKDMAAFSLKQHQDFLTYLKTLKRFGYSFADAENYIEAKKSNMNVNTEPGRSILIKCPECGSRAAILPVNDKPSTRTGDASKSVMMCHNHQCMYTEYSDKTVGERIKDLKS